MLLATPWVVPDDAERFWWDVQDDYVAVGGVRVDPAQSHPDRVVDTVVGNMVASSTGPTDPKTGSELRCRRGVLASSYTAVIAEELDLAA